VIISLEERTRPLPQLFLSALPRDWIIHAEPTSGYSAALKECIGGTRSSRPP
jgi:hypothetical protein